MGATSLIGREIPVGTYRWRTFENFLASEALYAEEPDSVHPLAAFVIAQRGMAMTVDELFELLGCSMADGPLLANTRMQYFGDLAADHDYRVGGEIESVERKSGKALGVFDLVVCRFDVQDAGTGEILASVRNTYAIPRRGEVAA